MQKTMSQVYLELKEEGKLKEPTKQEYKNKSTTNKPLSGYLNN